MKNTREIGVGTLIFGAVNFIGVGTAWYFSNGIQAGDILSFEGAVLGAAGAVLGAVYLEDRKRKVQNRDELLPLIQALETVRDAIKRHETAKTYPQINLGEVERSYRVLEDILKFFPPKRPDLIKTRHQIERLVTEYIAAVKVGAEQSDGPELGFNMALINIMRCGAFAEGEIDRFIKASCL